MSTFHHRKRFYLIAGILTCIVVLLLSYQELAAQQATEEVATLNNGKSYSILHVTDKSQWIFNQLIKVLRK